MFFVHTMHSSQRRTSPPHGMKVAHDLEPFARNVLRPRDMELPPGIIQCICFSPYALCMHLSTAAVLQSLGCLLLLCVPSAIDLCSGTVGRMD